MNKVLLIGNLTRDPELYTSSSGVSYCKFGIAVGRRFGKDEVDFFNITVWRQQAESCARYLKKGNKVGISGSIQINMYEKDGEKRQSVDIDAEQVEFLTPKGGDGGSSYDGGNSGGGYERKPREVSELEPVDGDDDLPF